MRNTLTVYALLKAIDEGTNPEAVVYEGDLETYKWDGEEYIGVNNERPLIEVLAENHTMRAFADDKLLDAK